jgi:hypothetical protein
MIVQRSSPVRAVAAGLLFLVASESTWAQGGHEPAPFNHVDPGSDIHPHRVMIRYDTEAPATFRDEVATMLGALRRRTFDLVPGLEAIDIALPTQAALDALEGLPFIEYAEPDYIARTTATIPNDPSFNQQWGLHNTGQSIQGVLGKIDADVDAPEAWATWTGGATGGIVIAVLDTGVQWNHPDLDANIWTNAGEVAGNGIDDDGNGYVDDSRGWDFYSNDNDPSDSNGHGSHVSGTIAAEGNNGVGVSGVLWRARIMPLRFLGSGGGSFSDAIEALQYAVNNGALISNNSWGSFGLSNSLRDAIAAAGAAGHLFVAAAGNDATNTDVTPFYPASFDLGNIISVAAITHKDKLASFSNYGALSVDLGAPGVSIFSTGRSSNYVWLSGTSMASPHVAGVAGLVWSKNTSWTMAQVRQRLLDTTRSIFALNGKSVTGGVVNARAALGTGGGGGGGEPPAAPSGVVLVALTGFQCEIDWSDNSSTETGFEIERAKKVDGVWGNGVIVATPGANVTSHVDPCGKGTWRYRVRAINGAGASAWTPWVQIVVR